MIIMCNQWFLLDCWRFRPIEKKGMFRFQSYQFVWSYELQLRNRVNQPLVGCKYMNTYVYVPNHTTIYNSLIKFISCNVHLMYNKGGLNLKKKQKSNSHQNIDTMWKHVDSQELQAFDCYFWYVHTEVRNIGLTLMHLRS